MTEGFVDASQTNLPVTHPSCLWLKLGALVLTVQSYLPSPPSHLNKCKRLIQTDINIGGRRCLLEEDAVSMATSSPSRLFVGLVSARVALFSYWLLRVLVYLFQHALVAPRCRHLTSTPTTYNSGFQSTEQRPPCGQMLSLPLADVDKSSPPSSGRQHTEPFIHLR